MNENAEKIWDILYWGIYYTFFVRNKPSPVVRVLLEHISVFEENGEAWLKVPLGPAASGPLPLRNIWVTPVAGSRSMDPWFDETDRVVLVRSDGTDVQVGDVVVYAKNGDDSDLIIHQVVARRSDESGPYLICRGLNNYIPDPFRVRYEWVRWVLVAVVY